ncbi:DNA helicase RecQ [Psychrosphaera ytuae]|uniref:DNA helicase RecQ n=1 Tax=Psychrosphaera ytuae TaxID=2820710 RepID=A0A975HH39_9GAMM|nr:DNA helicase RecQ [Psychrosphaera ytuae]QTH62776.1 DNA helicase RecQ [Psychrosphaera ytuae]
MSTIESHIKKSKSLSEFFNTTANTQPVPTRELNTVDSSAVTYGSAQQVLKQVFGYDAFRDGQEAVISASLSGQDTMVLLPTGGGKSLCYQIPSLLLDKVTIVVTPLLSLMKDQVDQLLELGIPAGFVNSQQTREQQMQVMNQLQHNEIKILYVSPERLLQYQFMEHIRFCGVGLFAIDEAHCLSHWGHDFRQDYLRLNCIKPQFPDVPIMALTATADRATRYDIAAQLQLQSPFVHTGSFDRPNLRYTIEEKFKPLSQLMMFLKSQTDQSGIVYCSSRARVDDITDKLANKGYRVAAYHAGYDTAHRNHVQEQFQRDNIQIVVATVAFGMGINKPNIRFVVHYDLPKTIESYYQETGRAGRDGLPAECLLFFDSGDVPRVKRLIADNPNEDRVKVETQRFNAMVALADAQTCRRQVLLNYFNEYSEEACGNCDICLDPPKSFDATVAAQQALSCIYRCEQRVGIGHIIDVLRGSHNSRVKDLGHDQLSTFAIGKSQSHEFWMSIIRQLIHRGFVEQDISRNSQLLLTDKARPILKGEIALMLAEPRIGRKVYDDKPLVVNYDKRLYARLKSLRKSLAEEHDVPPFVVFSDATLTEMASRLPINPRQLLAISGVGETKLARYGDAFIQVITRHLES